MTDANKAIVRKWFYEVWNHNNADAIDEFFAPGAHAYGFPEPDSHVSGAAEFKDVHRHFTSAFSGIRFHLDHLIGEVDCVSAVWTATMTLTGDSLGFPPTGRQVKLTGSTFVQFRDHRIVNRWTNMDLTKVALQLQTPSCACACAARAANLQVTAESFDPVVIGK